MSDSVPELAKQEIRKADPPRATAARSKSARTEMDASTTDTKDGLRDDDEGDIFSQVGQQMSQDPLVLTSSLLLVAYLVAQMAFPKKAQAPSPKTKRVKVVGKSQFAVSVNQRLMALKTWEEILDCIVAYQGRTDAVNVVTAVHRSTKLALTAGTTRKLLKDPRLNTLLDELCKCLDEDMPVSVRTRAVGNTSWALAKLNYREEDPADGAPSILNRLQASFEGHCTHFKPEELMNTVWAFAELSRDAKETETLALKVAKAAVRCQARFPDFSLQQVVYFSWALARLSTVSIVRADQEVVAGLMAYKKVIMERTTGEVSGLTTKNLAMVSWAVAHLHKVRPDSSVPVTGLLGAVAVDAAKRGLRIFAAGELASIVWALSKCQVHHAVFYEKFRALLIQQGTTGFSSQDLANVLCAFVNADAGDDQVYNVLAEACQKNTGFNRLEKTMVNWAFSQLPHIPSPKIQ